MRHQSTLVERLIEDEKRVAFAPDDTFLCSYPEFISYFQSIQHVEKHHLIIAANFTYAWMPTMLRFKSRDFEAATEILNYAKQGQLVNENELKCFARLINNSLVGASKLLHFVNPELYGIWDSRVYRYLSGNESRHQLNKPKNYLKYLETCQTIIEDPTFSVIYISISRKVGYTVTPLRALELVMFMSGVKKVVPELGEETLA